MFLVTTLISQHSSFVTKDTFNKSHLELDPRNPQDKYLVKLISGYAQLAHETKLSYRHLSAKGRYSLSTRYSNCIWKKSFITIFWQAQDCMEVVDTVEEVEALEVLEGPPLEGQLAEACLRPSRLTSG